MHSCCCTANCKSCGACCQVGCACSQSRRDTWRPATPMPTPPYFPPQPSPLTEEDLRRIIRDEIRKSHGV